MFRSITKSRPTVWAHQLRRISSQNNIAVNQDGLRRLRVCMTVIGLGTVSTAGYLCFPEYYTIHTDADHRNRQWSNRFDTAIHEWRYPPLRLPGALRIDAFEIDCNAPCEDIMGVQYRPFSDTLGYLWLGVFDGHNGTATSSYLVHYLCDAVVGYLADIYSVYADNKTIVDLTTGLVIDSKPGSQPDPIPPDEEIDEGIKEAFKSVDHFLVMDQAQEALGLDDASFRTLQADNSTTPEVPPLPEGTQLARSVDRLRYAESGSCALVGLYNTSDRSLRVALTGDSRAVLGRRVLTDAGYKYETRALTADQNAKNPDEASRLTASHPEEPDLLKNGRVVGWGPSRAFGDASMKWSRALQAHMRAGFFSSRLRKECKTPPYFTAEPVITTEKDVRRGDFAVFASDGLWDCLTSEEVVGLVGQWLEDRGSSEEIVMYDGIIHEVRVPNSHLPWRGNGAQGAGNNETVQQDKIYAPEDLPAIYPKDYKDNTDLYRYWRRPKKFVVKDENIAAHLTRNALAGADEDFREALLSMEPKRARRYRDDISVIVIFFE